MDLVDDRPVFRFTWQRAHGPDIVCEIQADGRGQWSAAVWLRSNPTVAVRTPKVSESRDSACAKADALARKTFDHVCDANVCGNWLPLSDAVPTWKLSSGIVDSIRSRHRVYPPED
jgi:hypothetical protein